MTHNQSKLLIELGHLSTIEFGITPKDTKMRCSLPTFYRSLSCSAEREPYNAHIASLSRDLIMLYVQPDIHVILLPTLLVAIILHWLIGVVEGRNRGTHKSTCVTWSKFDLH